MVSLNFLKLSKWIIQFGSTRSTTDWSFSEPIQLDSLLGSQKSLNPVRSTMDWWVKWVSSLARLIEKNI